MQQIQIKGVAIQECNSKEKNKAFKRRNKEAAHKRPLLFSEKETLYISVECCIKMI